MTTPTVNLGSVLPQATREPAKPTDAKPANAMSDVGQLRKESVDDVASSSAASVVQKQAESDENEQRAELNEALERISLLDRRLSFSVDESSGKSVFIIRDAQTSEVLKQFPSEEMLNVARRLEEHLQSSGDGAGVLHVDKA